MASKTHTTTKNITLKKGLKRPRSQNENLLDFRYKNHRLNSNDFIPPWGDHETISHLINDRKPPQTKSYDCAHCNSEGCNGCGSRD